MLEIVLLILKQIFVVFACMAFGYFCYKKGALHDKTIKEFSDVSNKYIIPLSIAYSFKKQFEIEKALDWLQVFGYSILAFALIMIFVTFAFPKSKLKYEEKRLCSLIPNNALIGYVIAEEMFGYEGIFLISAQILVSSTLLWTYGVAILSEKMSFKKLIFNPAMYGVVAGVILVYLPFDLPGFLFVPVEKIVALNSGLGLMIAGCYVARINVLDCLKDISYYIVAFYKLILGPLFIVPFMLLLGVDKTAAIVIFIGLCSPAGNGTASFTEMVGKDNTFSVGAAAFCEIACIFTIPIMLTIIQYIF